MKHSYLLRIFGIYAACIFTKSQNCIFASLNTIMKQQKWYKSWFNSEYYHVLYSNRNNQEADHFMSRLLDYLEVPANSKVLDIACGKGRHSIFLNKQGFDVTGIDLSENSIAHAKKSENESLHFFVHDMRKLFCINYFDLSLNLFTSFGYFETDKDHINALKAFRKGLSAKGQFVIDYFNVQKVLSTIDIDGSKTVNGIDFKISKSLKNGKILKNIQFEVNGEKHEFTERVSAFGLVEFEKLLAAAGFKIQKTFGNYDLGAFEQENSDRLIMICNKI